ncbi:MAG: aminoglycoside phosphotransferase family protein [Roseivirga sp.]|nr:aminoglycoside phosphotransferase family protein [Roseivirga sp.]
MNDPKTALENFQIKGAIRSVALFGGGHINDTYKVETSEAQYLLQRINTDVFRDTDIFEANLNALFTTKSDVLVEHVPTWKNTWLFLDTSGAWKTQLFDKDTYAPQMADDLRQVSEVAKGFGKFTSLGLSADAFQETIPDFHNLQWRLEQLDEAIESDLARRKAEAQNLIDQANAYRWINQKMECLKVEGLPQRLCHNDTKIDNILLSCSSNQFKYVIDLDTVGPGYALYDFGDMMRTLLSPTKESEPDVSKIELREDYYVSLRDGFLSQCEHALTALEIESLAFGGQYMTYIMAIRFLADYLNGDVYYKVSHEEENFVRARNQLRLLKLMDDLADKE